MWVVYEDNQMTLLVALHDRRMNLWAVGPSGELKKDYHYISIFAPLLMLLIVFTLQSLIQS